MVRFDDMTEDYFKWLCNFVTNDGYLWRASYKVLLQFLFETEFYYSVNNDENRAEDGIELRYRYVYEMDPGCATIFNHLQGRCSVLEMMIALSIKCEVHIMNDPDIGNRTGHWFWEMIDNLGLGYMTDTRFDYDEAESIISCFLNREYASNGSGGLFTVHTTKKDLREVEIWYQMFWYLNEELDR